MSKAEDKAWEWAVKNKLDPYSMGQAYGEGYHQAEKDLELTWKDMKLIWNITDEMDNMPEEEFYQEILKRFKKLKPDCS